ncbi:uncharacterized protein LOC113336298 [Papaver somniferum]|uniref:uncharacterized protein LOC113336298 n=1 Tax=Papaver somniferum TaxID=3469 RepID=UPI000E6FA84E|nr:uncharacterized protein LOC113336298 [Papaver somniferum]
MKKIWNLKGAFKLTINGDSIFLLEFDLVEDKISAMEKGFVFISNRLFLIRPWHLFIEQEIQEMKTFPIWLNLMNIPIHLWNAKGINMIASVLGIPFLTDKHTSARTRMNFARICIEIEADFDYPSSIPFSFGGKEFEVKVEYTWKTPTCLSCAYFGHSRGKCTTDVAKCNTDPSNKVLNIGWIPSANNGDKDGIGQMIETQGMSKEGVIVNGFKETSEKAKT